VTGSTEAPSADRRATVLEVDGLRVRVPDRRGRLQTGFFAVDGVSFAVGRGETFAVVGESGCGKTTLANAIVRLMKTTEGTILLDGADWSQLSGAALRRRRGVVQMVFQDPYGSLNPRMSIGRAVEEPLLLHGSLGPDERRKRVIELLEMVGLSADSLGRRPKALSGGQRQRVAIARALACGSALVICDEPTAALDVSIQAQVLNLLDTLQRELGVAYLFITHDLGVVRHIAQRVGVMYMGRFVEQGSAQDIFSHPLHPYTAMLLDSVLTLEPPRAGRPRSVAVGEPGDPSRPPSGCRFHPRCAYATEICKSVSPVLEQVRPGRLVACHEWRRLDANPPRSASPNPGSDPHDRGAAAR
jgi:oligopeptide transport system ATP-binding protein